MISSTVNGKRIKQTYTPMKTPPVTTGTWNVSETTGNVTDSRGCRIASFEQMPGQDEDETKANAQACAAIPDMLDALEQALSIIEDIPYPGNYAADKIRAALYKAGYTYPNANA